MDDFNLSLVTNKEKYLPYESIILTVEYKNTTDHFLSYPCLEIGFVQDRQYYIYNPAGERMGSIAGAFFEGIRAISGKFVTAGETIEFKCDLTDYYDMGQQHGKYTIAVVFSIKQNYPRDADYLNNPPPHCKVATKEIEIVPPENPKEKEALEIIRPALKEIYSTSYPLGSPPPYGETVIPVLEKIRKEYSNTYAAEIASYYRVYLTGEYMNYVGDKFLCPAAINEIEKFKERYPNSQYNFEANRLKEGIEHIYDVKYNKRKGEFPENINDEQKEYIYPIFKEAGLSQEVIDYVKPASIKAQEQAEREKKQTEERQRLMIISLVVASALGLAVILFFAIRKRRKKAG